MHARRRRDVLDDFRKSRPVHHLSRSHRDGLADHETFLADRRQFRPPARHVLEQVRQAAHEVTAALFQGARQHLRVGGEEIRRREHVEHLPRGEGRGRRVLARTK